MKPFDSWCVSTRCRSIMTLVATLALGMATAGGGSSAAESAQSAVQAAQDAALNRVIPAAMRKANVPGAIVGVWREGRRPYLQAFGVANTRTRAPMRTDF